MAIDVGGVVRDLLTITLLVLCLTAPVALALTFFWLGRRHLAGRRSRFDGLFGGIGRANAMSSHLNAGTPHPDDLAVPIPARCDGVTRRRRRARFPRRRPTR